MIVGAVASYLAAREVSPLLLYKPEQASVPFITFNYVARVLTQSSPDYLSVFHSLCFSLLSLGPP